MPTFETPEPIVVTLDMAHANVRIFASKRVDTTVTILGDPEAASRVRVELMNGQLLVKAAQQRRLGWALDWLRGSDPVDVEIELPVASRVHAKVAMGDFRCEGLLGECRLTTDYGDIRIDEGGPVQLATSYGDIQVEHADEHADITTSGGEIRVHRIEGTAAVHSTYGEIRVGEVTGDLRIEGIYGDVRVDRALAGVAARTAYGSVRIREVTRGSVELATTSGELEIGIRAGTAAWLDVNSTGGRVHNSLDAHDSPDGFTETVEIRARTQDGDILIRRA